MANGNGHIHEPCAYLKSSVYAELFGVPGGRDALRKHAGGMFLAKAGSNLRLRPGGVSGANREPFRLGDVRAYQKIAENTQKAQMCYLNAKFCNTF